MKKIYFIFIYYILQLTNLNAQKIYPQNFFASPVDIKIAIAGTFGELRSNHFHSGIDIKTKQQNTSKFMLHKAVIYPE